MAIPKYNAPGFTGSVFDRLRRVQRGVNDTDYRLASAGMAERVLGAFFRGNVTMEAVPAPPGSQVEYRFPNNDLVWHNPGPVCAIFWNRVELYPYDVGYDETGAPNDPGDTVPPGAYWAYRGINEDTGLLEQRFRLGDTPDPGDRVRALFYIRDFTL